MKPNSWCGVFGCSCGGKPKTSKIELKRGDVVRILHPQCPNETGVVNRINGDTISVFRTKKNNFATWFDKSHLKKIGGKSKLV